MMRRAPRQTTYIELVGGGKVVWRKPRPIPEVLFTNPMLLFLMRFCAWVNAGQCHVVIKDVDAERNQTRKQGRIHPMRFTYGQRQIIRAMMDQAANRKPIRIVIPKSRQVGATTLLIALAVFRCLVEPDTKAVIYAHTNPRTIEIFDRAKTMYERYTPNRLGDKDASQKKIEPPGTRSRFVCDTAGGAGEGRGTDPNTVILTEVAFYPGSDDRDGEFVRSIENSVGDSPSTIIVMESTSDGEAGVWHDRVMGAVDNDAGNKYKCVFIPWHKDPNNTVDPDDVPDEWDPPLEGDEIELKETHKISDEHLAWRRRELRTQFNLKTFGKTPISFRWEYPTVIADVFARPTGRIFPGLMRELHERRHTISDFGPKAFRRRSIDWGSTENHKNVVLYAIIDPDAPPGVSIDPSCTTLWSELLNYHWKPKRENSTRPEPVKKDDDTVDAFLYMIFHAEHEVRGHIHVYREYVVSDFTNTETNMTEIYRTLMRLAGYSHPAGYGPEMQSSKHKTNMELFQVTPQTEYFDRTIVDPAGRASIQLFNHWGKHLRPKVYFEPYKLPDISSPSFAKRHQIDHANWLISAASDYKQKHEDPEEALWTCALNAISPKDGSRPRSLTQEEQAVYDRRIRAGGRKNKHIRDIPLGTSAYVA